MSYETKAGVAVSCSFLCLVGVVLTSKLWDGQAANAGTPPAGAESTENAGSTPQPLVGNAPPETKIQIPKLQAPPGNEKEIQLVKGTGNAPPRVDVGALFPEVDDPFQQTPLQSSGGSENPVTVTDYPTPESKNQGSGGAPAVSQPAPQPDAKAPQIAVAPIASDPKKPDPFDFDQSAREIRNRAAAGGGVGVPTGTGTAGTAPDTSKTAVPSLADMYLAEQKKAQEAVAAQQKTGPDIQKPLSSDDITQVLAKQKNLEQNTNAGRDPINNPVVATNAGQAGQPFNNGTPSLDKQFKDGFDALNDPLKKKADAGNAILTTGANQPRQPANSKDGYSGQAETAAIGSGGQPSSPVSLGSPTSPPDNQVAQLSNGQNTPSNSGPPPIGTRPEASVQPMAVKVPTSPSRPQRDHWDDDRYVSQSGDTYQSIARVYYGSDRYAQALMFYNRDHPLASDTTRNDPATIVPGQKIYEPPARILERDFGSVIPDQSAGANAQPSVPSPAPASTVSAATIPLPEKRMRVRGGGAMFLTIARTTLSDENRWPEIYRLNPGFEPTNPVPGGTVLRMPGDAKIDPSDVPAAQ